MSEYRNGNIEDCLEIYAKHVNAMTAENLHSKSAIAIELAYRDKQIEQLQASLQTSQEECAALKAQVDELREAVVSQIIDIQSAITSLNAISYRQNETITERRTRISEWTIRVSKLNYLIDKTQAQSLATRDNAVIEDCAATVQYPEDGTDLDIHIKEIKCTQDLLNLAAKAIRNLKTKGE